METCNKMEYQPINRLIIKMCLPPMISMFLQYSYNMIDSLLPALMSKLLRQYLCLFRLQI